MAPQFHVMLKSWILDLSLCGILDSGCQPLADSRLQYSTVKILQTVNLLSCTGDYMIDQCSESSPILVDLWIPGSKVQDLE